MIYIETLCTKKNEQKNKNEFAIPNWSYETKIIIILYISAIK